CNKVFSNLVGIDQNEIISNNFMDLFSDKVVKKIFFQEDEVNEKEPFFPGNKSISDFMYTVLPLVLGSIFSYESFLRYQCADNAK
ncbi:hypothetical protein ACTPEM_25645, partial [Clostridioides difficile]